MERLGRIVFSCGRFVGISGTGGGAMSNSGTALVRDFDRLLRLGIEGFFWILRGRTAEEPLLFEKIGGIGAFGTGPGPEDREDGYLRLVLLCE